MKVESQDQQWATDREVETLRNVVDDLPVTVWIAAFVGAAERFTFYGLTAPWRTSCISMPIAAYLASIHSTVN